MVIFVDEEGRNVMADLINLAVSKGGFESLQHANKVANSVKLIPPQPEEKQIIRQGPAEPSPAEQKILFNNDVNPDKEKKDGEQEHLHDKP